MAHKTPPLFGYDWNDGQIERFENIKSEYLGVSAYKYRSAEAVLAFLTFKMLNAMIPNEPPHERPDLNRIRETALDIVCHRLCGDQSQAVAPVLHRRETVGPTPMEPDQEHLMEMVQYWSDELRDATSEIDLGHLGRLEEALRVAQADQEATRRAK